MYKKRAKLQCVGLFGLATAPKLYSDIAPQFLKNNCNLFLGGCSSHRDIVVSLKCDVTIKAPRPHIYCDIDECATLGDHLRRMRLHRNESQGCVAQILGLNRPDSLTNWELNHFQPQPRFYPIIIDYLGYTPLYNHSGTSLSKCIQQYLFVNGYSRKELAKQIGIDPISLSKLIDEQNVLNRTKQLVREFFS